MLLGALDFNFLIDVSSLAVFRRCRALQHYQADVDRRFKEYNEYKASVPVIGAVILDSSCQYCLLVKGWKASASWGFPKGKKAKDEEDSACAAREVRQCIRFLGRL